MKVSSRKPRQLSVLIAVVVAISMVLPMAAGAQGPVHIVFEATRTHLEPGGCALLEWHVDGGFEVRLNGVKVNRTGHRQACPVHTTPYTLTVDTGHTVEVREIVLVAGGGGQPPAPPGSSPQGSQPKQPPPQPPAPPQPPEQPKKPQAPMTISFRADRTQLKAGECTRLRWDVEHVKEVYLDGQGVVGHSSRQVCPKATHTFVLHIVHYGGTTERKVTIHVKGGGASPQPGSPGGNGQPAQRKAHLRVTDLYATRLRGGKLNARITNRGPGTANNERVVLSCNGAGWKNGTATRIGKTRSQKIYLGPGQTLVVPTGLIINVDKYDYYEMACTVQGQFGTSGAYAESIP
jgi:hypothetical protein